MLKNMLSRAAAWMLCAALLICVVPAAFAAGGQALEEENAPPTLPYVLIDNEVCRLTITGISPMEEMHTWDVEVVNKTNINLMITLAECSINEISLDSPQLLMVDANSTIQSQLVWNGMSFMGLMGGTGYLSTPTLVEFTAMFVDYSGIKAATQDYMDALARGDQAAAQQAQSRMESASAEAAHQVRCVVYPYGEESFHSDKHPDGAWDQPLVDSSAVKIVATNLQKSASWGISGYTLTLYIENKTDQPITVTSDLPKLDGVPADAEPLNRTVPAGKGAYVTMNLPYTGGYIQAITMNLTTQGPRADMAGSWEVSIRA